MMLMSILVIDVDANADDDSIAWQSKQPQDCYTNIPTGTTVGGFEEDRNRSSSLMLMLIILMMMIWWICRLLAKCLLEMVITK